MICNHERTMLPKRYPVTLKSLKNDKGIVILRADKDEATVTINHCFSNFCKFDDEMEFGQHNIALCNWTFDVR